MITIKILLKSAQLNKSELAKNYYIQKADILKHMLTDMLVELAQVTILNLLLHAGHISQCVDHNINRISTCTFVRLIQQLTAKPLVK